MNNKGEKRKFFEFHAALGRVQVRMKPIAEDPALDLPDHLLKEQAVVLNFSHKYNTPLQITELGVTQHLSFGSNGQYTVHVPWETIFYIEGPDTAGTAAYRHWPDEDPTYQGFEDAIPELPEHVAPDFPSSIYSKSMTAAKKSRTKRKVELELIQGGVADGEELPTPPIRGHLHVVPNEDK